MPARTLHLLLALLLAAGLAAGPAGAQSRDPLLRAEQSGLRAYYSGRYEEAVTYFREALEIAEARRGSDDPSLARELNNLAEAYRLSGRYEEAEALYERALALDEKRIAVEPDAMATTLNNLALLYRAQGRLEEASRLFSRALALFERALGPGHPNVAKTLNNMAVLELARGRPDRALLLVRRALAIGREVLPPDHPTLEVFARNLERVRSDLARRRLAEAAGGGPEVAAPTPAGRSGEAVRGRAGRAVGPPVPRPPRAADGEATARMAAVAPAAGGRFAVHLASVRSPAAARSGAVRLQRQYPELADLPVRPPEKVEIAGKGTFYRIAYGYFADRGEARKLCRRLRARGAYCDVTSPGG